MHAGVFIYRHSRRQKYNTSSCIGAWSQSYLADSPVAGPSSCTFSVATSIKRAAVSYGKSMLHRNHIWLLSLSPCVACLPPVAVLPCPSHCCRCSFRTVSRVRLSDARPLASMWFRPSSRVTNVVDVECCSLRPKSAMTHFPPWSIGGRDVGQAVALLSRG